MPTCPQLHQTLLGSAAALWKRICFVLNIFTLENISREGRRRACPRRQKAAVCRILIGPSVCLMLVFDVFPRIRAEAEPLRGTGGEIRPLRLRGSTDSEGEPGQFTFSPPRDGFVVSPFCLRRINIYCLCPVVEWEGISVLPPLKPLCIKLWSRAREQDSGEECSSTENNETYMERLICTKLMQYNTRARQ